MKSRNGRKGKQMIKEGVNKRLRVTADGILIPNDIWISGKYYILRNENEEVDEKNYMRVQFSLHNKPVTRKGYFGTVSVVTLKCSVTLAVGEYVLKPDHETEERIILNSFCIVDTSKNVEKTADIKVRYNFRLYRQLFNRSVTILSKKYPDIKDLENIRLSDILALRGISQSGVYFIAMVLDDLKISMLDDVFTDGDLQRAKDNTWEYWILI